MQTGNNVDACTYCSHAIFHISVAVTVTAIHPTVVDFVLSESYESCVLVSFSVENLYRFVYTLSC